ncbi:MAG: ComF family protein [Halioglobus sp.]
MQMVNNFLEALYPVFCELCGLRSHRRLPLCSACQARMAPNNHSCQRCALPLPPSATSAPRLCGGCQQQLPSYTRVLAPWLYDEHMAFLMHRWKFMGEQRLSGLLAGLWLEQLASAPTVDAIVPVPLHWRRLCHRGFNQSELLCHQLRRQNPLLRAAKLWAGLVSRRRTTATQSSLDASHRSDNLRGAFEVCHPCDGLRLAIVDDVMTTGSTVDALAKVLCTAGAASVEVWCIARTPAPGVSPH